MARAAAAVVAGVLLIGVALLVVDHGGGRDRAAARQAAPAGSAPSPSDHDAAASAQACPANEGPQEPTLAAAPATTWRYQEFLAFPVNGDIGPALTTGSGRFCFQHSPAGALFMAANGSVNASISSVPARTAWAQRAIGAGRYHEMTVRQIADSSTGDPTVRAAIAGFKVLDYTGSTATIDLAVSALKDGRRSYASSIWLLVWQDGDWRSRADVAESVSNSTLPDLAGYIPWGP